MPFCGEGAQPEKTDRQEGQEVEQEIPAAEAGGRGFDVGGCFAAALGAVEFDANAPLFLDVEVYERFVLNLAAQVFALGAIASFGQATANGLGEELDVQIVWYRAVGRRLNHDEERADADVRIRPD